jgi:hypothetical protein
VRQVGLVVVLGLPALAQEAATPAPAVPVEFTAPTGEAEPGLFRFGINANLGVLLTSVGVAPLAGLEIRFGHQFGRVFGLHAELAGVGGLIVLGGLLGALAEFTLGDHVWIATGPAVGLGLGTPSTPPGIEHATFGGLWPAWRVKLGYTFGDRDPATGRRSGLTVGLDLVILRSPAQIWQNIDQPSTDGVITAFIPSLIIGYDLALAADASTVEPESDSEVGRVRFGVNANLGLFLGGGVSVLGGLELRLGYQFGRLFGLYADLGGLMGFSAFGGVAAVVAEFTFRDHLSIALGPGVYVGYWVGAGPLNLAGRLKFGYTFGDRDPATGRRHGLTIGLDGLALFEPNARDASQRLGPAMALVPTLALGYDLR